jgi:glycosyltransferase 2 family protein
LADKTRKVALSIIKYTITLGVAAFLLWYVYRDLSLDDLLSHFYNLHYKFIFISILLALMSHYIRAYRWNMLLEPLGYNLTTSRTFIAVMVGYFANNLVPRLGEVTRCGILKKNDGVAMTSAFGSVVAERALDLLILVFLAGITFTVEFDTLNSFVAEHFSEKISNSFSLSGIAVTSFFVFVVAATALIVLFKIYRKQLHRNAFFLKLRKFVHELLDGFLSIRKIKNQYKFWLATVGIWGLYYAMLIVIFYAYPPTSKLELIAGLTLLIMSGLGMSAPVQGGIGVFHILVSSVLVLYGISAEDGKVFALIAHTTQFMTVMLFGGISFIISLFMKPIESNVNKK